jgi:hypothetical protein
MAKIRATIPASIPMFSSVASPTQPQFQAVNDYVSVVTLAEEDAVIDRVTGYVNVKQGGVTGSVRIGIQSVNTTTGLPSGTWLGFADFAINGTNFPDFSTKQWTLSTTATVTRGQFYAIVFFATSGNYTSSGINLSFYTVRGTGLGPANNAFPYTYSIQNGVASGKSTTALIPNFGCGTSTRQYGIGTSGGTQATWNSGTSPNQRGMKFKLPASLCTTFKVVGVRMAVGPTNASSTWDLNLYDSSSTVLQNRSYNNLESYNTNSLFMREYYFDESTLTALSPNTDYRIAVQATNANGCMSYIEMGGAFDCSSAFIPDGTFHLTTRTGTGAWTDTTTSFMPMQLIIDDFTASASGGGMLVHPGMLGGIRG